VHPSGKFVYGSNRGHDSIAVFAVGGGGALTLVEYQSTRGRTPRNFALDPTGRWLITANQQSDTLAVFSINETTGAYFKRLATISPPEQARQYLAALSLDSKTTEAAYDYFMANEPRHASMITSSISPNIFQAGYRINVIPSEAKAELDVRLLPDEDPEKFLDSVRQVIKDPSIEVKWSQRATRPGTGAANLESEAFRSLEAAVKRHYNTITLPTMSTGATDMAFLRAKGIQCYGIGPATDSEDGPRGFGAHSDQERILESELFRFVRFNWDVVIDLALAR